MDIKFLYLILVILTQRLVCAVNRQTAAVPKPVEYECADASLGAACEKNTAKDLNTDFDGLDGMNVEITHDHYNGNIRLKDKAPKIMAKDTAIGDSSDNQNWKLKEEESVDIALLKGHKENFYIKQDLLNSKIRQNTNQMEQIRFRHIENFHRKHDLLNSKSKQNTKQREQMRFLIHRYFRCAPPIDRLGNMMFQLSATIGIAHTLRYKPFIEPHHPLTHFFETGLVHDIHVTHEMVLSEEQCIAHVWNHDKRWRNFNLTTWGYLQSWKYFQNATEEVKKALTVRQIFKREALRFLSHHTKADDIRIGLHVRRGDFTVKGTADLGFATADMGYIGKAMNFYRKRYDRAIFVVVSDDIPWCRENIKGVDVIFSPYTEPIVDMAILSSCSHSIITGGTFGWWGA